jgi:hypothetical protein
VEHTPGSRVGGKSRRTGANRGDATPPDRVERFILPFVREPTLWPVLLVVIGHAAAAIAPAMLLAVRDRNPTAWLALVVLAALSVSVPVYEVDRQRRPGALSAIVLVAWLLGAGLALVAHHYGAF